MICSLLISKLFGTLDYFNNRPMEEVPSILSVTVFVKVFVSYGDVAKHFSSPQM